MASCKINNVDVVTDTSSIRCVIVISEDVDALKLSNCNLSNIWKQVVRNTLWILTDQAALMSTDWIEVAKQDYIPLWVSSGISVNTCSSIHLVQPYGLVAVPFGQFSVIGISAGEPYTVAEELKIMFLTP